MKEQINENELKCIKCNNVLSKIDNFCQYCGEKTNITQNNVPGAQNIKYVKPEDFDTMFKLDEEKLLETAITKELLNAQIDLKVQLMPSEILKRKKIFNIIFFVLFFIYISLIFFHFPLFTYVIGFILLLIFLIFTRKYNMMKYLKKEIKSRPSEKISNIVMNLKNTNVIDNSKKVLIIGTVMSFILPIIIFLNPIILYEKIDGGYSVRYYIFGLTNFTTATIPETYKNEKVISLRGNTFSNMPFLEKVTLPDTITEIRGQAFKNDTKLKEVKLPNNLKYLGGGAFYNCTSLTSIEIPDTVTYIGGEAFYNATSLENIKLPNNIVEIRGNTFENCTSLKSITIPDNVARIGAHAFYGNTSLKEVNVSEKSKLKEIGSSAFRKCKKIYSIKLPVGVFSIFGRCVTCSNLSLAVYSTPAEISASKL